MRCKGPDGKAGVAMHSDVKLTGKGDDNVPCYYHYHNTMSFGLAKSDYRMNGLAKKRDWKQASPEDTEMHYKKVRRVLDDVNVNSNNSSNNSGEASNNTI